MKPSFQLSGIENRDLPAQQKIYEIKSAMLPMKSKNSIKSSLRKQEILSLVIQNTVLKKQKAKKLRKQQPLWTYIITAFSALLMGAENLYLFMWEIKIPWVFFSSICLRVVFFVIMGFWFVHDWRYYFKLFFVMDRVCATGVAMMISVMSLCIFMEPVANYPWLYTAMMYGYPPFIVTSMAYSRILMVYCTWKPWQTIVYKISLILSASSYIAVAMFFIFDPNMSLLFIPDDLSNSFISIVILYSYAGFDFHIETLSQVDDIDGTTNFRGTYELVSNSQDMQFYLYGKKQLNPKYKIDESFRRRQSNNL